MNKVMLSLVIFGALTMPALAAKKEPIVCLFDEVYDEQTDSCVYIGGNDSFLHSSVDLNPNPDNNGNNGGDGNNGHGNDRDGHDESNPGKSDGPKGKGKGHGKHGD